MQSIASPWGRRQSWRVAIWLDQRSAFQQPPRASTAFMGNWHHTEWHLRPEAFIPRAALQRVTRTISQVSGLPSGGEKSSKDLGACFSKSQAFFHDASQQGPAGSIVVESNPNSGMAQAFWDLCQIGRSQQGLFL